MFRRILKAGLRIFDPIFLLFAIILAAEFGQYHWLLDLFSNFYFHICFAAFVLFSFDCLRYFLLFSRKVGARSFNKVLFLNINSQSLLSKGDLRKRIFLDLFLCLWIFLKIYLSIASLQVASSESFVNASEKKSLNQDSFTFQKIKTLSFNLYGLNKRDGETLHWLTEQKADLIFVQEYTYDMRKYFTRFSKSFPYRYEFPRGDFFGGAIFSKFPIINARVQEFSAIKAPILLADVKISGQVVKLINMHPSSPTSTAAKNILIEQILWARSYLANYNGPFILAGDLNSTIWSWPFKDLLSDGYNIAAVRAWWQPTWHNKNWGVLIDHVLYRGFKLDKYNVGPALGSDHFPVVIEFLMEKKI